MYGRPPVSKKKEWRCWERLIFYLCTHTHAITPAGIEARRVLGVAADGRFSQGGGGAGVLGAQVGRAAGRTVFHRGEIFVFVLPLPAMSIPDPLFLGTAVFSPGCHLNKVKALDICTEAQKDCGYTHATWARDCVN